MSDQNKPPDLRRDERVSVGDDFHAVITDSSGAKTEATVRDVSAGGAGLTVKGAFANDAFVDLHMGTFGKVSGRVARQFVEGIGVEFDMDDAQREQFKDALLAFRRAGGREKF